MRLSSMLPRPLSAESGSDSASLLGSILTAAYFERLRARELGWRGIRPSAAETPAWSCRVANSRLVFGVCFEGEDADTPMGCLRGWFSLYAFPTDPEDPLFEQYPLAALRVALSDEYGAFLREFTSAPDKRNPFLLGMLRMDAALDGNALGLTLEAAARHRVVALDGIPAGDGHFLVEPGAYETDVPAFVLLLRWFTTLIATVDKQLGESPVLFTGHTPMPGMAYDAHGVTHQLENRPLARLTCTAAFGTHDFSYPGERAKVLQHLPLRRLPNILEGSGKPLLHILTGFLGSGKTTFLRGWLDFLHGRERYTGVIQNEFGAVDLDAVLLSDDTRVEALDEGCVCCTLSDSLRPGIERLMADMPAESFILETTGLANPANVFDALHELRDLITPGLVVTVVDSLDLQNHTEDGFAPEQRGVRRAQIEKADVLILNKIDAAPEANLAELERRLRALNRGALILRAGWGRVPYAELDAFMDAHPDSAPLPSRRPVLSFGVPVTHADEGFTSTSISLPPVLTREAVTELLNKAGDGLFRAKGLANITGEGLMVVQYAAGQLRFEPAPAGAHDSPYLVFIGQNLN